MARTKLIIGLNDLATVNPELAKQWHPLKNEDLTPRQVLPGSNKKIWWQCEKGHEWQATVYDRNKKGSGCPQCNSHRLRRLNPGNNDLLTVSPELASQWHPAKNGGLTPDQVSANSSSAVWWKCQEGHEWRASVHHRNMVGDCPVCTKHGQVTDENRLSALFPELAKEWHPTQNESLTPDQIPVSSTIKVWWQCEYGHEWQASASIRISKKNGCPVCYRRRIPARSQSLLLLNPELASQWHPTNNEDLLPQHVSPGSTKKVWWQCEKGHEWQASVYDRNRGSGCPQCNSHRLRRLNPGENDLLSTNPEVASQWHPTKNGDLTPDQIAVNSNLIIWWQCQKGHEWRAPVYHRTKGSGCPQCNSQRLRRLFPGQNDLQTVNPLIAAQWHPTKNGDLTPDQIAANSNMTVWWQCHEGHEWRAIVFNRNRGSGCPICADINRRLRKKTKSEAKE